MVFCKCCPFHLQYVSLDFSNAIQIQGRRATLDQDEEQYTSCQLPGHTHTWSLIKFILIRCQDFIEISCQHGSTLFPIVWTVKVTWQGLDCTPNLGNSFTGLRVGRVSLFSQLSPFFSSHQLLDRSEICVLLMRGFDLTTVTVTLVPIV